MNLRVQPTGLEQIIKSGVIRTSANSEIIRKMKMMNMHVLHEQLRKQYSGKGYQSVPKPVDEALRTVREETGTVDDLITKTIELATQG